MSAGFTVEITFDNSLFGKRRLRVESRKIVDVEYEEISSTPPGTPDAPALDAVLVTRSRAYPETSCKP